MYTYVVYIKYIYKLYIINSFIFNLLLSYIIYLYHHNCCYYFLKYRDYVDYTFRNRIDPTCCLIPKYYLFVHHSFHHILVIIIKTFFNYPEISSIFKYLHPYYIFHSHVYSHHLVKLNLLYVRLDYFY